MREKHSKRRAELRKIRLAMRYSFSEFAELLGVPYGSYTSYESGHRPLPDKVLDDARAAQQRDRKFFKELPKRVDKELAGKGVPNECRAGEW